MGSRPSSLLVLALCLGQAIHMHKVVLPKPSISAKPGPVICLGQPVTIVCRGPAEADLFRLEKNYRDVLEDQTVRTPRVSERAEGRFHIPAVSADTAGSYGCFYHIGPSWSYWSERSEPLELKVTGTTPKVTPPSRGASFQTDPASWSYMVGNCVRIGQAGVVLLILVAILAEAGHSWHRWPHGPQGWTQGSSCQTD